MKFVMKWQLPLFELTYWITPWFAQTETLPPGTPNNAATTLPTFQKATDPGRPTQTTLLRGTHVPSNNPPPNGTRHPKTTPGPRPETLVYHLLLVRNRRALVPNTPILRRGLEPRSRLWPLPQGRKAQINLCSDLPAAAASNIRPSVSAWRTNPRTKLSATGSSW